MQYGKTEIILCSDYDAMGRTAARDVAECLKQLLAGAGLISCVFAAAQSQTTFLNALAAAPGIDWSRILCFNMDELWSPPMDPRNTCAHQTSALLYNKVQPRRAEFIRFNAPDPQVEADRFAALLRAVMPIDVLCQGIGTSGHLALNEPGQTAFDDPRLVAVVTVDEQSKRQLMQDPNFMAQGFIPDQGITMTIPALMSARHIFTMVPLAEKRPILTRLLATPAPSESLPASILWAHPGKLYVDRDSCPAALLPPR